MENNNPKVFAKHDLIRIMLQEIPKVFAKHDLIRYTNLGPSWFKSKCRIQKQ